ncbi:unnamed protein product [Leptidea sinapis]|uniref:Uncharacterized protein n=1 Tax=Leptidea sinapis TaxID=189913 RepID=A0A5E4Q8L9_9NEOP|nr:unnamed protein product [Leptidea sinapis]
MECQMCKKVLSKRGSHFVSQGACGGTFHRGCVKGLAADLKMGRIRLHCNNCINDDGSDNEDTDEENQNLSQILKDIQKKVGSLPQLKKQLEMINESMSVLSEKYDKLLTEHEQSKQKIIKSEKNILSLNSKCVYLEKSNIALEQKVHELEQSSLKHNIEIVGIEQLPDEDVEKVVSKIGETMNVSCVDIESARRTRQTKPGVVQGGGEVEYWFIRAANLVRE